jgi:hypothetical protein
MLQSCGEQPGTPHGGDLSLHLRSCILPAGQKGSAVQRMVQVLPPTIRHFALQLCLRILPAGQQGTAVHDSGVAADADTLCAPAVHAQPACRTKGQCSTVYTIHVLQPVLGHFAL